MGGGLRRELIGSLGLHNRRVPVMARLDGTKDTDPNGGPQRLGKGLARLLDARHKQKRLLQRYSVAARSGRRAGQADLWQEVKEFLENALEAFGSGRYLMQDFVHSPTCHKQNRLLQRYSVAAVGGRRAGQADLWQEVKEFLENALEAFGSGRPPEIRLSVPRVLRMMVEAWPGQWTGHLRAAAFQRRPPLFTIMINYCPDGGASLLSDHLAYSNLLSCPALQNRLLCKHIPVP
ncbi:hypothetical protein AK812_SmicGene1253 [Symbiodinium microadriaticum]|uniref:Uncharacterized protein n=1 Tax=Symbiodinium microadriaticum TaxID=2951 RepID=A0A1Q9F4G6_SYMMI|nr:hypothetical protein AK812_SmicGene1253 [Symbiodinium microadriaticum]